MGLHNTSGSLRRLADNLQEQIDNSGILEGVRNVARRFVRYIPTMTMSESTIEVRQSDIRFPPFFAAVVDDPRDDDIVAGRWFTSAPPRRDSKDESPHIRWDV